MYICMYVCMFINKTQSRELSKERVWISNRILKSNRQKEILITSTVGINGTTFSINTEKFECLTIKT